jgi:GNAT superfamily N-acetyltransferase
MNLFCPTTDDEINACFSVIQELRPHLKHEEFLPQIRRQEKNGYRLVVVRDDDGTVLSVAGYRISEFLFSGKFLYVDDLVTGSNSRRKGHASALISWLAKHAGENGCKSVHLDSGFALHPAHRFYLSNGFHLACHHFCMEIPRTTFTQAS